VLIAFVLVLARVSGLVMGAPVLKSTALPRRFRVALAATLAAALLPAALGGEVPSEGGAVAAALVGEFAIGLALGLTARLFLSAFQLAGHLISYQAGFAMARAFDPESGAQSTVVSTLYLNLATVLFLLVDGHHLLIRALAGTFASFPVGSGLQAGLLAESLLAASGQMFESGARIAAPVTGVLLLINATVGFLNRVMPQLSIFNIGFPLTVLAGMISLLVGLPEVSAFFLTAYEGFAEQLTGLVIG
jgi:flagellar biosynthetic protein FliR